MKWFHAIGASGKTTANVAKLFKDMGWFVTGSDSQFLPPASKIIEQNDILFDLNYNFRHLTREFWIEKTGNNSLANLIPEFPDLCMIVESATAKNKEYLFAKKKGIKVLPFSKILSEYLIKEESIVVIGTAGKTTTTAFLVKLLQELNENPSYMIGGETRDFEESLMLTDSRFSVIEGDEYHNPELSDGAKFLEFKPKYLIITNIGWEHQDIFPTKEAYINEFRKAVQLVPEDGLIIAKAGDKNIEEIIRDSRCRVIKYDYKNCEYTVETQDSHYTILNNNQKILTFNHNLIGDYNNLNFLSGFILGYELIKKRKLGVSDNDFNSIFSRAAESFKGVKKRLEILTNKDNLVIIDDFGVAPLRAKNSLDSLKKSYPDYRIYAVFEPNSGSREKSSSELYKNVFNNCEEVIIPGLSRFNENLLDSSDLVKVLKEYSVNATEMSADNIEEYFLKKIKNLEADDKILIIFFSSYRLTEIVEKLSEKVNK